MKTEDTCSYKDKKWIPLAWIQTIYRDCTDSTHFAIEEVLLKLMELQQHNISTKIASRVMQKAQRMALLHRTSGYTSEANWSHPQTSLVQYNTLIPKLEHLCSSRCSFQRYHPCLNLVTFRNWRANHSDSVILQHFQSVLEILSN